MYIYRAVFNDDSVSFIGAESLNDAYRIASQYAEQVVREDLLTVCLCWSPAAIEKGRNRIKINDEDGTISFLWFGKVVHHDLITDASV